MPNGAELFVRTAAQLGLDTIFTLVGDHLNEVLLAAARAGLCIIDMRHESSVTHAADAWARIHRKPALALVTGGPGHTNSLTGIATAQLACSPLIAVSGSRASTMAGRGAFQDMDQVGMARPVVKWAAEAASPSEIPGLLMEAYRVANAGRKGAVHLTIPIDCFENLGTATTFPGFSSEENRETWCLSPGFAERPVVIAGSGVWWAHAEDALRRFIEHTSLPLYTITMARGSVPDDHPLVMGYADPALNRAALTACQEADGVLIIGKRIDYRLAMGGTRLFSPEARFIQVDIHRQELGHNRKLDVAICADARAALEAVIESTRPWPPRHAWLDRLRELRAEWQQHLTRAAQDTGLPLHPAALFRELNEVLPRDVLFSWDGGDFVHWGRAMLPARQPGGWLRLGPLGTIGSALPNAIALQLAHPGRPVCMITGDGALGFYLAEMDTAVRFKLPIVMIVGNDAGWGLERELQTAAYGGASTVACELQSAHYETIMEAFGGRGEFVERLEEVKPAVERAFRAGVPYCINVKVRGVRSPFTEWQIAGKKRSA
jgi:acetolactate synthase-1/2/3 large subunit